MPTINITKESSTGSVVNVSKGATSSTNVNIQKGASSEAITSSLTGVVAIRDEVIEYSSSAASSASEASLSATSALSSKTSALASSNSASASEATSTIKATEASDSASNAATSESNAATSASEALASQLTAATAMVNSQSYAAQALSSSNNAKDSEVNAAASAAAAATWDPTDYSTTVESDSAYEPKDSTILKDADIGVSVLSPIGDGSGLTGIASGGIGEFKDTSIAISSDGSALANDDGTGNDNIALGKSVMINMISGSDNISMGDRSGYYATGLKGVYVGYQAGYAISSGTSNTALGNEALKGNLTSKLTGSYNTGIGYRTGYNLTTGQYNVLNGYQAGYSLVNDIDNVMIGKNAGKLIGGNLNVVIGSDTASVSAGNNNYNVIIGSIAGKYMSSGANNNTAVGYQALTNVGGGDDNVAIGSDAGRLASGSNNTFVGESAGWGAVNFSTGTNSTMLGSLAIPSIATASNEITLGNSAITSLRCAVTTITALSDERDKDNIQPLDAGLDFINTLNPVRFDWDSRDGSKVGDNDIGFIAQELIQAQTDSGVEVPHLVMDNNPDKLEAGYGMLIAPMVKAIQELTARVAELEKGL